MASFKGSLTLKIILNEKLPFSKVLSSINGCLPSNVVFHQNLFSYSMQGVLPSKVFFNQRMSFIKSPLSLRFVIFQWRLFLIKTHLLFFHCTLFFIKGPLPLKVTVHLEIKHLRLSFIECCLPLKVCSL